MSPDEKADALLRSLLTPEQLSSMDTFGHFQVRGNMGGVWLIRTNSRWSGNLRYLLSNQTWQYRCAAPPMCGCEYGEECGDLPTADAFIAQLLAIQTDEARVRKVAVA